MFFDLTETGAVCWFLLQRLEEMLSIHSVSVFEAVTFSASHTVSGLAHVQDAVGKSSCLSDAPNGFKVKGKR